MRNAYVYYRVDPERAAPAARCVDALLLAMAPHCGQPPRRMVRCDEPAMWMEIYEDIGDFAAFSAALAAAEGAAGCMGFIRGERHLECFRTA